MGDIHRPTTTGRQASPVRLRTSRRTAVLCGAALSALAAVSPALAEPSRTELPVAQPAFDGTIRETMAASTPASYRPVRAPEGAPNIFLLMADDVGFAMSSTFGGPVPTPNMDRLAQRGQRYNRFHSAGVCSPSRAALLTGRNPHRVGTGHIVDLSTGYPGYNGNFPRSAATIAQTLRLNGYNTAMFGKHHNIPPGAESDAGPFDMWPTGLGFEYFFGFPHGEADQIHTNVYRGTSMLPRPDGPSELFEKRMADDTMRWVRNHLGAAPDKPFFIYFAPGSTHAPHQAPPDVIARFKGKFDQGWDAMREEIWQRQRTQGIIPRDAELTARPPQIAAWASLSRVQRAYALRGMEVAAAMLAYQDEQLGRVLDEMERTGVLGNTLVIVIQGDNGASGDGDAAGVTDEMFAMNFVQETESDLAGMTGKLGGEYSHGSYAEGWGWAMNTPFRWYKSKAGMLGAIRDGMIVAWPGHVSNPGKVCDRFGHLVDIAPTLLEAARVPAPDKVFGVEQMTLDGVSLMDSFTRCQNGPSRTQYFEVGGKAGLYHDGWLLTSANNALAHLAPEKADKGLGDVSGWEIYDLTSDFSQTRDLTAKFPGRRQALFELWRQEAERNHVLPIRSGFVATQPPLAPRNTFDFWGGDVSIPAHPNGLMGKQLNGSFTLKAEMSLPKAGATGVIAALGSRFSGWSLMLEEGRPVFVYARSVRPQDVTRIAATEALPAGPVALELRFHSTGVGKPARAEIVRGSKLLAGGDISASFNMPLGVGEKFDAGRDSGSPVTEYRVSQGLLEGEIRHISIEYE